MSSFVETEFFQLVEAFIETPISVPIFVYGPTGLGKTTAIIEAAKKHGRKAVKFNVSVSTTVDDMVGGIRLENGNTVFKFGPLINAMLDGDIIVLDELDAGDPVVLMELQPILEGKSYTIKKTGEVIEPKDGFMIVATGNTKGTGDMTGGEYVGTNVLNKAFRDRFAAWIEYNVPTKDEIESIVRYHADQVSFDSDSLIKQLARWFTEIYEAYDAGGIASYLSVRKIILGAKMFKIFGATEPTDQATETVLAHIVSTFDDPDIRSALTTMWDAITQEDAKEVERLRRYEEEMARQAAMMASHGAASNQWPNPTASVGTVHSPPTASTYTTYQAISDEYGNLIPYNLNDL